MEFETLEIGAFIENLDEVVRFIEDSAANSALEPRKKFGLMVAVEEAFVNICHYAYPQDQGDVKILSGFDNDQFVVEISDCGVPFDLLSLPEPDTTTDIMEREIGGLGVHFIRTLTDQVSYRRENGHNVLKLVLKISNQLE